MKVLPFGERALLAEFASLTQTMAAFQAFSAARVPGIVELIPAATTVLAQIDPTRLSLRAAEQWLSDTYARATRSNTVRVGEALSVTIPVRYDGPDLASVALLLGVSIDELVSRHSQAHWQCAFIGFAPGFAYLASTEADFNLPRRETSRTSVAPGSVGLAGEFTGIYPRNSPGGWQLIGATDVTLWDEARDPPAAITPGMIVRFEVVTP
ncbi:allophanate hydrolase subunit 1 [Salinibacterium sp. M195]|uniref:5-oxoprolinase subunit B family protein n=1 Tax=Salinibacterium sp. M195 TaxID=2583374 RepID=UPI00210613D2|nr:allophanate hydrolase subunit 1 [Salinibacterium sp. M195]QYH36248.1 allophanate hydrolase subunit 1 [Salinibacterium sp. M195]